MTTKNDGLHDITSELHHVTGAGFGSLLLKGVKWVGKRGWAAIHPTKERAAATAVGGGIAAGMDHAHRGD